MTWNRLRTSPTAVALGVGLWGCGGDALPETGSETEMPAGVVVAETVTTTVPLLLPAQLYVEHDAFVFARSLGIVEAVRADVGDRVRRGAVLADLEDEDQTIAAAQAEAAWETARRTAERMRELLESGAVSQAEADSAALAARRAELALRQARRDLTLTRVVAPFDGVVAQRRVRVGQLVEELDTLFRVTALAPLKVSVHVPEQAMTVAPGDSVEIRVPGRESVAAVVDRVAPTVDPASGTREVVARLPRRGDLMPGTAVEVRVGGEPRSVLAIPRDLLLEDRYVLVWEDGRSVLRAVTPGAVLPDGRLEIVAGLAPGERLVRRP